MSDRTLPEIDWRRPFGHLLVASVLGPYVFAVGFGLLEFNVRSNFEPRFVLLDYPMQMLVFGAPVVLVFAILSSFPLIAILRIKNPGSRRRAFVIAGGALGLMVGGAFGCLVPGGGNAAYVVAFGVAVGLGCGVLDWIIWRPGETAPS